jgi:hypothetical protein
MSWGNHEGKFVTGTTIMKDSLRISLRQSDKQHHASSDLEGTIHALRSLEPPVRKVGASGRGWYTINMDSDYIEEVDLRGESSQKN